MSVSQRNRIKREKKARERFIANFPSVKSTAERLGLEIHVDGDGAISLRERREPTRKRHTNWAERPVRTATDRMLKLESEKLLRKLKAERKAREAKQ